MSGKARVALHVFTLIMPGSAFMLFWSGFSIKQKARLKGLTAEILMKELLSELWMGLRESSRTMETSGTNKSRKLLASQARRSKERGPSHQNGMAPLAVADTLLVRHCGHGQGRQPWLKAW